MPKRSLWLDKKLKRLGFHRRASNSTFHNVEEKDENDNDEPNFDELNTESEVVRPSTAGNMLPTVLDFAKNVGKSKTFAELGVFRTSRDDSLLSSPYGVSESINNMHALNQRPHSVQLQRRVNMEAELLPEIGKKIECIIH